ncbi:glycerophosphoryl diester phosphodiesterase protein, putative [Eimeria tenella]|uniref:Glycerophosphoryl diester phosphodiesterase protein, putative n=1 Tax=Eimeria tenella TaxID=5802 RepID=U6L8G5_EIMTE|nr:glycerophosphoryl diester phosphodiesterase protein, putative [Eimeria tenella]CDJ45478.1 glycerophosphoryl diester phosphodiesterase protein, putative [Eimeria tenella]|eukprot:XP_013236224.1 glycerophosphoryl diester phosphodiesterase protein, putative [Eimeria tenella]
MEFYPEFVSFPRCFGAEKIPLLEEVFEKFPGALINVDLKGPPCAAAVGALVGLTAKYGRQQQTVFAGFDQDKLLQIKQQLPAAVVAVGPRRTLLLLLLYYTGLLPFCSIWEDVFELPVSYSYLLRDSLRAAAAARRRCSSSSSRCSRWLARLGCTDTAAKARAWLSFALLCNPSFISSLKRRGLLVLGWVANSEKEFQDAFYRIGCHGVMTDRPSCLQAWLAAAAAAAAAAAKGRPAGAPPAPKRD